MSSGVSQQILSIFCLLYPFICTGFAAKYNMTGINLIDENDFRVLNFGPVINNSVIEQSIFAAYEGKTRQKCLWACTSTPGCVAYNYGSNGGICQLSNDTSPCALVPKPGFVHHGVSNFRECYKVFANSVTVSVTSDKIGEFVVDGKVLSLTKHGYNFLAIHKGTVHKVMCYDIVHNDPAVLAAMNEYIDGLPDGVVVLMAAVHDYHISESAGVGRIRLLGSNATDADLVGKQWWALIGCKGSRQPWIAEGIESSTAVTRSVTTYTLY